MTARTWCEKFSLIAAVNAGMYQQDGFTNVGLMKTFNHVNNQRLNNVYKAVLAFNRLEPKIPEIQIIDLKCQDFEMIGPKYQTLIQNIRMIGCHQENVWAKTNQLWGMAVFFHKTDIRKAILLIHPCIHGSDQVKLFAPFPCCHFRSAVLRGTEKLKRIQFWIDPNNRNFRILSVRFYRRIKLANKQSFVNLPPGRLFANADGWGKHCPGGNFQKNNKCAKGKRKVFHDSSGVTI